MSVDLKLNDCQEKQLIAYAVQKKVHGFRIKTAKKLGLIALLFAFLGVLTFSDDTYASIYTINVESNPQFSGAPFAIGGTVYDSFVGFDSDTSSWDSQAAQDSTGTSNSNYFYDWLDCRTYTFNYGDFNVYFGNSYLLNFANAPHHCVYGIHSVNLNQMFRPQVVNGAVASYPVRGFQFYDSGFSDSFLRALNNRDHDDFTASYSFEFDGGVDDLSIDDSKFTFVLGYDSGTAIVGSCTSSYDPIFMTELHVVCSANLPAGNRNISYFSVTFGYNALLNSSFNFVSFHQTYEYYSIKFSGEYVINDAFDQIYDDAYMDVDGMLDSYRNRYDDGENASFFGNLINAFRFSVLNPFAPLFDMFSDAQTCQPIPVLATMLHVENPQSFVYCAWFPSSVRNILTPVISGFATLIVFGFFVSWLKGSSNGIFSDDSRVIKGRGR